MASTFRFRQTNGKACAAGRARARSVRRRAVGAVDSAAMGIDDLTATDAAGRLFNIVEKGRPLTELF